MEEDNQDGPFTLWTMFNKPTMELFKNLENAGDGLETLLLSILKSRGDFTDVLVPKPGIKHADSYYKAFNTWLIGRCFYIWSVKDLQRIHTLSKDVQLKILNTLIFNQASFSNDIQNEYIEILTELTEYYKRNVDNENPRKETLKHFTPEKVIIPKVELDLQAIYVQVANINSCKILLEQILDLLSQNIPYYTMGTDLYDTKIENVLENALFLLENYNLNIKLISLNFFVMLIANFDKVAMTKFCFKFKKTINSLFCFIEALLTSMPIYYSSGDLNDVLLTELNMTLLDILKSSYYYTKSHNKESLISICVTIHSNNDKKLFSKDIKHFCLSMSKDLQLPDEIVCLQLLYGCEIELLSQFYVEKLISILKNSKATEVQINLKKSYHFKQVISTIHSIEALEDSKIEFFIQEFELQRCLAALNILQKVLINYEKWSQNNSKKRIDVIAKEEVKFMVTMLQKIFISHGKLLFSNTGTVTNILDLILGLSIQNNVADNTDLVLLASLQKTQLLTAQSVQEIGSNKALVLKYLLMLNIMFKETVKNEQWTKLVGHLFETLVKEKSSTSVIDIIDLSPLILINGIMTAGKLIGDILLPAFQSKDNAILACLLAQLPKITCIALGSYAVALNSCENDNKPHGYCENSYELFKNAAITLNIVCEKCHTEQKCMDNYLKTNLILLSERKAVNPGIISERTLFAKFLNMKMYGNIEDKDFIGLIDCYSNHTIFNDTLMAEVFKDKSLDLCLGVFRMFVNNISLDENIDETQKDAILNICINILVQSTKETLETNDYQNQSKTIDCIKEFGLSKNIKVVLPSTKLLVYFIMHPQCNLSPKAVVHLKEICENHKCTPNQVYHKYKKDYCKLFVDLSLHNEKRFALAILNVVRAFGFDGYIDFISKDVHHFLPYLVPYTAKLPDIPAMIEEIASLVQCSAAEFLTERFPHIYTHVFLYETEATAKKSYALLENMTKLPILMLIKKHFRVILTEFLLQYCCNPDKVLAACRYLALHDPESHNSLTSNMSLAQIADFLNPRFLGVLAYFDSKLINAKVALSVKRKALQSFPDIMKLMGTNYLTPLRFKVLATLRSAMNLAAEFPKIVAQAWSAFIHNIDSISLGPLLPNLAVSLLQQMDFAANEINKIFQYLVINNENLLSSHISDLFFLENKNISGGVKLVIQKHVKRSQPEGFLDRIQWYLNHLNQDIPEVKSYAYTCINKLLKGNRPEIHKATFSGRKIHPVMVELIDALMTGCKNPDRSVRLASGACLGQLGAIEAGHLPRQYVKPDRSPFAFNINDDCFAATALFELTRAFQYEKDTKNMDCYALSIQEILKFYDISPNGGRQQLWSKFPEHIHQIMVPLLSSKYTLAFPSQPKKTHPLFGSNHATSFLEWAFNWAGQLIPLVETENIRELLRTAHPSMRRDVRTLLLFLPYVLLHAIMGNAKGDYVKEEILSVIGLENFEHKKTTEISNYRLLRNINTTPNISSTQTEEGNQSKCCKMVYVLMDFLNRWLMEWCHEKTNPTSNDNYKKIQSFLAQFDKLTISRGNFLCGEFERALQYLELYMIENKDQMQAQLSFLAEIYALLDEPDAVAGILSIKHEEPSLKEAILAHVVTGRLTDAATCYERLAKEGPLDHHTLQGMVDCYLSLDQPYTAYRLLSEHHTEADTMMELACEPLWRLGRFDELKLVPARQSRENWGLLMGRILLSFRSENRQDFTEMYVNGLRHLLTQMEGESKGEAALRSSYQNVLGMHIVTEARHAQEMVIRLKSQRDTAKSNEVIISEVLEEWRYRTYLVQSDVRTLEPLLRCRRIFLQQSQELLQQSHPQTAAKLNLHVGQLWLQSAKHARKAGIFQQAYIYILNAEEYRPEGLFIEKAKMYWARGQQEPAFTTLKRGLDDLFPDINVLSQQQRKICAKAKLLFAKLNDETTNVDVDVNIVYYKEAVEVYRHWEKSLVCLGAYYEKASSTENQVNWVRRLQALDSYGKALQYGHTHLYQSMPRMLSIWLNLEVSPSDANSFKVLTQMTEIISAYSERLPLYLYLTAFSQIVSRICHPVRQVYKQLKGIIIKLILAYPQHTLWMMMCVIKSSYPQRIKRCQDVLSDPRLKEPQIMKLVFDFTQLAEKLIELCNKPITNSGHTASVSNLVRTLPRLLAQDDFSHIMMPFQQFCKIVLPSKAASKENSDFTIPAEPEVYIAGIEDQINILQSLQKPRKVTLKGSNGKSYIIMLKPKDDLRKDFRLMEFNAVVNRFLQDTPDTRRRRLYIRTYSVFPLNEECGLIQWVENLVGLRPILLQIYKQKGLHTSNRVLKEMMCQNADHVEKKRKVFETQFLARHPPVFQEWFRRTFSDPYGWYQARSAYIRTTAVMSMVGYILGLGDRHGENISFDSTNGDTVHVDFNCLFNKGEAFEWPERVPFRLTHNMEAAMGPLKHEGPYRKCCEAVMRALRDQTAALMSIVGPFVYDPLLSWGRGRAPTDSGERTNQQAKDHLLHIKQRLNGTVRTKGKHLSLCLSPEGQVEHLIEEATSINNLCQMYIGWGPFL